MLLRERQNTQSKNLLTDCGVRRNSVGHYSCPIKPFVYGFFDGTGTVLTQALRCHLHWKCPTLAQYCGSAEPAHSETLD